MDTSQFESLLAVLAPDGLRQAVEIATIVMAIAAIYALFFAYRQIGVARKGTKATFIVDLDRRWEGPDMREARVLWSEIHSYVVQNVETRYPELTNDRKVEKQSEVCSQVLYSMLKDDPRKYASFMQIIGFFETIGYTVNRGFLTGEEIADLYGESILEFDRLCRNHITKRQEDLQRETGAPTKLYEHAFALIDETRRFYGLK